jgi:gamma-glutamylcyclotransferase (GGCT)/AIG2-like uncharacterized protein YtfP
LDSSHSQDIFGIRSENGDEFGDWALVLCSRDKSTMPDNATMNLFSYGTLQLESVQIATFGRLLDGQEDAMVGFRQDMLEITDPEVLATSGQRFHPVVAPTGSPEDEVPGTVFRITPAELVAADSYEVSDYRRIAVTLRSGTTAWVYVKS